MDRILEQKYLLSFYGDDFTGSTDTMESLALNGVRTALFLHPPTEEELENFQLKKTWDHQGNRNLQAFGVAGISRSLRTEQMSAELIPVFEKLKKIGTDFFHYKICSTFDSSPKIGSIGFAIDLAFDFFPSQYIPLIVGAPFLNRFTVFGNLFARIDGITFRLDRHPTMSRHPVTPMDESDLRVHLSKQTKREIRLFDLFALEETYEKRLKHLLNLVATPGEIVLYDTLSLNHLINTGEMIVKNRSHAVQLLIGASSTEHAICQYLHKIKKLTKPEMPESPGEKKQIIAISGSCAPTTGRQIEYALRNGFEDIKIDTRMLVNSANQKQEEKRIIDKSIRALEMGKSIVIYSAIGPEDPIITATRHELKQLGLENDSVSQHLGISQGNILKKILLKAGRIRTVVCGGDTSGHVSRALDIYALETLMPISPGAPLCYAHSKNENFDGLEISLKGGQNGSETYIQSIKQGKNIDSTNI
jgi:3-oxoisoapionate kinase